MAKDYLAGMAQPELVPGMKIVLEAVNPDSGSTLFDVVISEVVIEGNKLPPNADDLETDVLGLPTYVPGSAVA